MSIVKVGTRMIRIRMHEVCVLQKDGHAGWISIKSIPREPNDQVDVYRGVATIYHTGGKSSTISTRGK